MSVDSILASFFPGAVSFSNEGMQVALARAVDEEFGKFSFAGRPYFFNQLPTKVRADKLRWVFYGKGAKSLAQARLHASRIFSFGRETRGAAHRDVWKHLKGTDKANYGVSGFMQTGRDRAIIEKKYVLGQQPFGALYVINCRGAEVLDVDAFAEQLGQVEPENGDGEILFSRCLPPSRILGAGLYASSDASPSLVPIPTSRLAYAAWRRVNQFEGNNSNSRSSPKSTTGPKLRLSTPIAPPDSRY